VEENSEEKGEEKSKKKSSSSSDVQISPEAKKLKDVPPDRKTASQPLAQKLL